MPAFTDAELTAQGCDLSAAVTGYTAGASASSSGPATDALVPCFSPTGFGGQESSIGFAKDGSVYLAPAYGPNGNGLARSSDYGKTWTQLVPGGHGRVQPFLYVDPATDRVFFATSTLNAPDAGSVDGLRPLVERGRGRDLEQSAHRARRARLDQDLRGAARVQHDPGVPDRPLRVGAEPDLDARYGHLSRRPPTRPSTSR